MQRLQISQVQELNHRGGSYTNHHWTTNSYLYSKNPFTVYTLAIFAAISNAIFFFWYIWTSKTDLNSLQPTYKVFLFPQKVSEGYDCWATRGHRERELDMFEPYLYTHSVENMLFTF